MLVPGEAAIEFKFRQSGFLINQECRFEFVLQIRMDNFSDKPMVFPLEDGFEALYAYRRLSVGNFFRGLLVVFAGLRFWLRLGLTPRHFFRFPWSLLCTIAVLMVCLSTGTLNRSLLKAALSRSIRIADLPTAPSPHLIRCQFP